MAQRAPAFQPTFDHVVERYLNPLPRTIARTGQPLLLDGLWHFELDIANRGLAEHWEGGHAYSGMTHWPGSIESQLQAGLALPWDDEVVAWYERTFTLPAQWAGELVQVTFGAVGYETRVWLNGTLLQTVEGEPVHMGEFTSFSYELPQELLQPENRLTVRIADSLDAEIPRGKQASRMYKRGGIWYQTTSGALRSVWLEVVERNRLRSYLAVDSQLESNAVSFDLTTRIYDPGEYHLKLVVQSANNDIVLVVREWPLVLEAGTKHQQVTVVVPDAECWEPQSPVLYRVIAQLIGPDGNVSQISANWGMRRIEARGHSVFLNNEPLYLDGILYQPAEATWDQIKLHLEAMRKLGCNLVRIHIAGIDPRMYDLADELGMLLWVEIPSPHSSTERSRENHWAELRRMARVIRSHPSVVIWSMYNEDWGIQDIAGNAETRAYINRCHDYLKLNCPQVLVVDNDGWRHVSMNGKLQSDLLTAHIYQSNPEAWEHALDRLCAGDTAVTAEALVVGDPFFYEGQVPLVVSEWGGFGFEGYGGPTALGARGQQIKQYKQALRARPIAGDVYTQATNVEDERNGLIDFTTGELLVPDNILHTDQQLS
ncbi:MAG: glycoside hydrolase family 2 [Herpetosiphonaceae bacterium]|nr:glycoside hydrolase family 2 [Herpetosiphonaceae bacterium]